MYVTTRLTKTVVPEVKFTFPDPEEAFSQPMYMSSRGTWTSCNLFCGWLHAKNCDVREKVNLYSQDKEG